MSFFSTTTRGFAGVTTEYQPAFPNECSGGMVDARIRIGFTDSIRDTYLTVDIDDARSLVESLRAVIAEHESATAAVVLEALPSKPESETKEG